MTEQELLDMLAYFTSVPRYIYPSIILFPTHVQLVPCGTLYLCHCDTVHCVMEELCSVQACVAEFAVSHAGDELKKAKEKIVTF